MRLSLPDEVEFIIDRLFSAGFRADVVGGPVRDFLMGRVPHDYDITTSATPDEVKAVFADLRTVDTGIKHGTVTLVIGKNSYEITTYRIDGEYRDSRRPETVSFTSDIVEDLARRDFTMNAIAYNPRDGITDPWGGREDIERGLIRAVREPHLRFTEDALRILRGIRFASTLGFSVDEATRVAIFDTKHLLLNISAERIYTELYKLFSGEGAERVLAEFASVIEVVLPEVITDADVSRAFRYPDAQTRLLSLFAIARGSGAGEAFNSAMHRLKTDSATRIDGARALSAIRRHDTSSEVGIIHLLSEVGYNSAVLALRVETSLGICPDNACEMLEKLVECRTPYRPADLDLNGNDLIEIGITGAEIGRTMRTLLEDVMSRRMENRRQNLLAAARALKAKNEDNPTPV